MSGRGRNHGRFLSNDGHVGYERNTLLGLARTESRVSASFPGPTVGEEVMTSPLDDHFGCSSVDQIDAEFSIRPQGILGERAAILASGYGEASRDGRVSHHDPGIRKAFRVLIEIDKPGGVVDSKAAACAVGRDRVPITHDYC